jgi:hypothetical protein
MSVAKGKFRRDFAGDLVYEAKNLLNFTYKYSYSQYERRGKMFVAGVESRGNLGEI